jgi:lipopolysaccharide biosynthesis protein
MRRLGVFAHFDPQGEAAPHVLRHLDALNDAADRVVVVTTAQLTASARHELGARGEVVERANEGYDFYSWRTGLEHIGDWFRYDHVLLANDSVVGPVLPYPRILAAMEHRAPAWGIVKSQERTPHLQSFVMGFFPPALRSPLFQAFWRGMVPLSQRSEVIVRYELGLARLLAVAMLDTSAYFEPTRRDDAIGRRRRARLASGESRRLLRRGGAYNPMIALWDRALDGRLPFVKIETLRDDPYRLDGDRMLAACERAHPDAFDGVRRYLERTRADYARMGRSRQLAGI